MVIDLYLQRKRVEEAIENSKEPKTTAEERKGKRNGYIAKV